MTSTITGLQEPDLQGRLLLGVFGTLGAARLVLVWPIELSRPFERVSMVSNHRYSCNRYDEDEAKAARDAQERSRAALQRYLFYCNRYMNHMQSLKFESKLYASIKEKMEEMQQHNMSWIEVQFLKKAVDVLCQCRQTLMYTYVFAYYLLKTNQSIIFEDNQRDLESATEMLSEYLERDITHENLSDIKQKVQDKYRSVPFARLRLTNQYCINGVRRSLFRRYCESRRRVLLQHVLEGYDKDWWEYTVKVDRV